MGHCDVTQGNKAGVAELGALLRFPLVISEGRQRQKTPKLAFPLCVPS